jgi:large subunit ribosomal protein L25
MAGERIRLQVQGRDARGSAESRRLRSQGLVPGVLYGNGKNAHAFSVTERELRRVLTGGHGMHAILDVVLEGQQKPHHAVLKDYQVDPIRSRIVHVDLHEVRLDRPIQTQVVVELVGTAEGVTAGGVLSQVVREVNVEALPMDVPDRLPLDVSGMTIGDTLRVADLSVPESVTLLDDEETVLANVTVPTRVELPEEMVSEEEEAAAVEGLPPDQQPEGAADQPADADADAAGSPGTVEG